MTRRGLTLIEVLAATVLLSIMTAAVLPTLTSSLATLHSRPDATDLLDLSKAADAFVASPGSYGFKDLHESLERGTFDFAWKDADDRVQQVNVTVRRSTDDDVHHAWLVFQFMEGDQFVMRWAPLAAKQGESAP